MTSFAAGIATMHQASARTASIGAELRAHLQRLHREADAVLTGAWLGRAADTFDRGFAEWEAAARTMLDALDELAACVDASAAAYLDSDLVAAGDLVRVAR